jgi:Flp pilus assembly protein TadG
MSTNQGNIEATQMKSTIVSFVRRALHDERGQVLPWLAMGFVGMLGMGGLTVDVGRAYVVHAQLQNYANAAVLAAAGLVYNTSTTTNATTEANAFSGSTGDENASSSTVGTVTTNVYTVCLNSLQPPGATCPATKPPPNAVRVVEQTTVPTYFMNMLGVHSLAVAATATASMQGQSQPWNVAIILDASGSMSTTDTNCGSVTEFQCALNGIQAMLGSTNPCKSGVTSCTNAAANFHVALFAFPPVSTSTVTYENACSSYSTPAFQIYTLPLTTATSYTPIEYQEPNTGRNQSGYVNFTGTYEVTLGASDADANGFVSDYYSPTASNGLNTTSSIVKAVSGCMKPISQEGSGTGGLNGAQNGGITYYASILYAAQAALTAEAKLNTGTNNAIIFLSDGQANVVAATNDFPTSPFTAVPSTAGLNTLTGTGHYPDTNDECQQAIFAAQAATTAKTQVYSVAYGSEQTGCYTGSGNTDTFSLIATGKNQSFTLSQLTPCVTMENIASSLNNFYSDYNQSGSGSTCQDASHTVTSLSDIFLSIAASFTQPRLIPNTAT